MTLTALAWLGMVAYAFHILEEYMLNWRDWARNELKLPVQWNDFYVTNGIAVALGISQAMLAAEVPLAALGFAGLMLINGILMHIVPFVRTGRYSPGVFTAVVMFLPLGTATFWTALSTNLVSPAVAVLGLALGGLTLAFPIVMLNIKTKPFFRQA
jgi:hypothetical protein